jgi:hypothetical protein
MAQDAYRHTDHRHSARHDRCPLPGLVLLRGRSPQTPRPLARSPLAISRAVQAADLADASVELTITVAYRVIIGDIPGAVPLARQALALARLTGAPALVATGLLAMGVAVAVTDPG